MPCMGPSKDAAVRRGDEAFELVYALLVECGFITTPGKRPTLVVAARDSGAAAPGIRIQVIADALAQRLDGQREHAREELKTPVRELVWADACCQF